MDFSLTITIIILTAVISFSAFGNPKVINDLIFWPPKISKNHQYYRFLTSGFIHADIAHLAFNMITLYFFGRAMEEFYIDRIGKPGFLLFYAFGIVCSEIPSYLKNRNNYNYRSLGASGAVTAILFSFILLSPWSTLLVFFFPMPAILFAVLYLVYTSYMAKKGGDNINHSAHLWGAIYGVITTIIIEPKVLSLFIYQLQHPRFEF
jgi:membrane associated rhomboid family serine protease